LILLLLIYNESNLAESID